MYKQQLPSAIRAVLCGGATLGGLFAFASAQAQDSNKQSSEPEKKAVAQLDAVEVLGSRIKRTTLETAQPVVSLGKADIDRTGLTSVGDILKELDINGPSLSLTTNNGNTSGQQSVNLRSCGAVRTLVLVNGRRWIPGANLDGSVDLSSIPTAAIDRIDILKDGASALYGTDAICGVVNLVTKSNWNGAQFKAYYGQYDQDDGAQRAYDMTFGHATDRWSVLASASYTNGDGVSAGNRPISAVPVYGFPANVASPGRASPTTPYGNFRVNGVLYTLDPSKTGCVPNQRCTAKGDFKPYDFATDGYNFAPVNWLIQPQTTKGLFAEGTYRILDNVRLKVDGFLNERSGQAQLAAQPLSNLPISKDNIYNPFGANIANATFRPTLFPRQWDQSLLARRFSATLEGDFTAFDRTFNWDVGGSYGKNKLNINKAGFPVTAKLIQALGPSYLDASGKPACGTASAPISGCVPLNLFGGPNGVTSDMWNFIKVNPHDLTKYTVDNYTANLSSPSIFALPAGDLAFAAGYEYRREKGFFSPDPLSAAGQVNGDNPVLPTQGGYSVNEAYLEFDVPVLKNLPFAQALDVSVAARRSDYSTFGSTTNPKVSLQWRPVEDLLVRGSWGKGFRAPSINELYAGNGTGRPSFTDPCSTKASSHNNPVVIANCAAAGVPANFVTLLAQTFQTTGGNPNVQPERSRNKTLGVVYSPSFLEGFDASLDWYNLRISNLIDTRSAQYLIDHCYISGLASACAAIKRDLTGAVVNGNPGEISNIFAVSQNLAGGNEIEGFDFAVNYRFQTDYGRFKTAWSNSYTIFDGDLGQLKRNQVNQSGDISDGNYVGHALPGVSRGSIRPRLRSQLTLGWENDVLAVSGTFEYYSKIVQSCATATSVAAALTARGITGWTNYCTQPGFVWDTYSFQTGTNNVIATPTLAPRTTFPSVTYFDLQATWKTPWKAQITGGIRNLFDKDPPFSSDAFANSFDPQYRIPGRFFYASYTQNFDLF